MVFLPGAAPIPCPSLVVKHCSFASPGSAAKPGASLPDRASLIHNGGWRGDVGSQHPGLFQLKVANSVGNKWGKPIASC